MHEVKQKIGRNALLPIKHSLVHKITLLMVGLTFFSCGCRSELDSAERKLEGLFFLGFGGFAIAKSGLSNWDAQSMHALEGSTLENTRVSIAAVDSLTFPIYLHAPACTSTKYV